MKKNENRSIIAGAVMIRLDEDTNNKLLRATKNSNRSKTNEATVRLRDHLNRFPDFYNSEHTNEISNQ